MNLFLCENKNLFVQLFTRDVLFAFSIHGMSLSHGARKTNEIQALPQGNGNSSRDSFCASCEAKCLN